MPTAPSLGTMQLQRVWTVWRFMGIQISHPEVGTNRRINHLSGMMARLCGLLPSRCLHLTQQAVWIVFGSRLLVFKGTGVRCDERWRNDRAESYVRQDVAPDSACGPRRPLTWRSEEYIVHVHVLLPPTRRICFQLSFRIKGRQGVSSLSIHLVLYNSVDFCHVYETESACDTINISYKYRS